MISREDKLAMKKNRLAVLEANGKNVKSPGVIKRLHREIRNMEAAVHE